MKKIKILMIVFCLLTSAVSFGQERTPGVVFMPGGGYCTAYTNGGRYIGVVDAHYCNPFVKGPTYKFDSAGYCQEYNSVGGWIKTVEDDSLCCKK
jgi:hypothetical protein